LVVNGYSLVIGALVALLACVVAQGQDLEFSLSPSPVGSGARAAGMADAFVAIADDATAASWNPAGLVQLERPELSLVYSFNRVRDEFFAPLDEEVNSTHSVGNDELNYLSAVYPLPFLMLGRNAVISLNYQRKYDFSRTFAFDFDKVDTLPSGRELNTFMDIDFVQSGGLATISPAFAIELSHRLSVGVAVNLWRSSFLSDNSWKQHSRFETLVTEDVSSPQFGDYTKVIEGVLETRENYRDFSAENMTLGVLWNPVDKLSLGLRYDSGFSGDVDYRLDFHSFQFRRPDPAAPDGIESGPLDTTTRERRSVRFPDFFAVGAAYRANDRLTFSLDVTRADWNDFYLRKGDGTRISLVDASELDDSDAPHFDPTYAVRFGVEYAFVPKEPEERLGHLWTLRGGLFFDQEPATGRTGADPKGSGNPDDFYGGALGVGLLLRQRLNLDLAYQLRYGDNVNSDLIRGIEGFREDVLQHRLLLSTVLYF